MRRRASHTFSRRARLHGFVCPACGRNKAWQLQTKAWTWECAGCGKQTSVTAGTIMHHSKPPLTTWFWAACLMATHSNGISALQLQRQLDLGSYKTAWLLCAELRRSVVAPGRSALAGLVEVNETEIADVQAHFGLAGPFHRVGNFETEHQRALVREVYRTTTFEFEGVSGSRREFITWLLKTCAQDGVKPADPMDAEAIELLAERLRTALQIEMHMTLAFEHAFRLGESRVSAEVVEQVLSHAIDELEPTLTRNGYDAPALSCARPSPSIGNGRSGTSRRWTGCYRYEVPMVAGDGVIE